MTALIQAIFRYVSTILGIVTGIQQAQAAQATEATVDLMNTTVNAIFSTVNHPTYGNFALYNLINALITETTSGIDAIEAQITAFSPGGTTVEVGGVTVSAVDPLIVDALASAVWNFDGPTTGFNAIDLLEDAGVPPIFTENWATTHDFHQLAGWEVYPATNIDRASPAGAELLPLDFTTVEAGDATAVDWLNRVWGEPHFVDGGGGAPSFTDDNGNQMFVPWLQTPLFELLRDRALGATAAPQAPVWPGLDGVTLGTPVDISLTFTVDGPMAGVLVALTAVPALKGQYDYDGLAQSLKIGALTFVSDNGDAEYIQALGFTAEVYVPKNMAFASSCKVRTVSGVEGTVTPFTIP